MSEKKKATTEETTDELEFIDHSMEPVKLTVPRIPGVKEQPDWFCSVNGKNYLIQRGHEVTVPRCVKEEYERSVENSEKADEFYYSRSSANI